MRATDDTLMRTNSRPLFKVRRQQEENPRVSVRRTAWNEFCDDARLRETLNITPEEMETLRLTALLGNVRGKDDFIFILKVVRRRSH